MFYHFSVAFYLQVENPNVLKRINNRSFIYQTKFSTK